MNKINWGIIGCGDVTEIKSGPAFNKVAGSSLVAVMRRDAAKAKDYAQRHGVPRWYNDANDLIHDPEVNAVYIATPPSSHELYCIEALKAGKNVYVEKPMALNALEAVRMAELAITKNCKLVVAHYRRQQPFFKKIKSLIDEKAIGETRYIKLEYCKPPFYDKELLVEKNAWRVDPSISGGGIFHDLAPHQLDLMLYLFGPVKQVSGIAINQAGKYPADDMVTANILFDQDIPFTGTWCFNGYEEKDSCEIVGSNGKISFAVFNNRIIHLSFNDRQSDFNFETLQHVQQPMIEATVQYFLGQAANPCTAQDGAEVMRLMDEITKPVIK